MPNVISIDDVQPGSTDLDELRALLKRVIGKPFLCFRASYGDELTLHLGEAVPYANPRMKGQVKGSYIVASRGSSWILEPGTSPGQLITSDEPPVAAPSSRATRLELTTVETRPTICHGAITIDVIASAAPKGILLSLVFSDGSSLLVLPNPPSDPEGENEDGDPLPDWEIFMPRHRILKAGPGQSWSYTDSQDRPNGEATG